MMVEGEANECSEEDLVKAIELGHEAIKIQIKAQQRLRDKVGSTTKREYTKPYRNEALNEKIIAFAQDKTLHITPAPPTLVHHLDCSQCFYFFLSKMIRTWPHIARSSVGTPAPKATSGRATATGDMELHAHHAMQQYQPPPLKSKAKFKHYRSIFGTN